MKKKYTQHIIEPSEVDSKIIVIRNQHVILDSDIAELYGVKTRDINKSVKNNPDKFPDGYIIELNKNEKLELVENFHRLHPIKHSTALPKAFTEKGLYMLATILKSMKATATTISIIETFSKTKEIAKTMKKISTMKENSPEHQSMLQKTGELISDLIVPEKLNSSESEATIEFNLAVVKFKYRLQKKSK